MVSKRVVLTRIVQGFSLVAAGLYLWPFVKSSLPEGNAEYSREIDISDLMPGQSMTVPWLGRHVFIVRRTQQAISALRAPVALKDPDSLLSRQPGFAFNPGRSIREDVFVAYKNCTHLGCEVSIATPADGGFNCPCHFSEFDASGRVLRDAVALYNLEVPDYRFVTQDKLMLIRRRDA